MIRNRRTIFRAWTLCGWILLGSFGTQAIAQQVHETPSQIQHTVQSLYPRLARSTVFLMANDGAMLGSGVVIETDGLILTHGHHEKLPRTPVIATFPDGRKARGKYLGVNEFFDQSLIRLEEKGPWPAVRLGSTASLKPGDPCLLLGYPKIYYGAGKPPLLRVGRVIGVTSQHLFTSDRTLGGDSGGPIFNKNGELLGTHQLQDFADRGSGQVCIEVFKMLRKQLLAGEYVGRGGEESSLKKELSRSLPLQQACKSVVTVMAADKPVGLGLIVAPDGMVLTKASELSEPIRCRFWDGRSVQALLIGKDSRQDLALLRVAASDLPSVSWSEASVPIGQILATLGPGVEPLDVSTAGSPLVDVAPEYGELAVDVKQAAEGVAGVVVSRLWENKAKTARVLRVGDLITHLGEMATPDTNVFFRSRQMEGKPDGIVGNTVELTIVRDGKTMKIEAPVESRSNIMLDAYLGRRTGFPSVFVHDAKILRQQLGGPVVDLEGKVVGINIAAQPDGITYAIPASVVRQVIAHLRTRGTP